MTTARVRPASGLPLAGQLDGSEVLVGTQLGAAVGVTAQKVAGLAASLVPPQSPATKQSVGLGSVDNLSAAQLAAPGSPVGDALSSKIDQGPFRSLLETTALTNLAVVSATPSAAWKGRQSTNRYAPAGRSNFAYVGNSTTIIDGGSGVNGPANAAYGLSVTLIKDGFPSQTAVSGEMDNILLTTFQSGPRPNIHSEASDANQIQANLQMVDWTGFVSFIEALVLRLDPVTYQPTHGMVLQQGLIDGYGKNGEIGQPRYQSVNPLLVGYFAGANTGPLDRAFYATNAANGSKWDDFTYFGSPGAPMRRTKGLDGRERFGPDGAHFDIALLDGALQILGANGQMAFASYQGGTTFLAAPSVGNLKVAGVEMLTGRNTLVIPPKSELPESPIGGEVVNVNGSLSFRGGSNWIPLGSKVGAWANYTPIVSATSGSFTTVIAKGRYQLIGDATTGVTLIGRAEITISSAGSASGLVKFSLPAGTSTFSSIWATGNGRENAVSGKMLQVYAPTNSTDLFVANFDGSSPIANGAVLIVSFYCELSP